MLGVSANLCDGVNNAAYGQDALDRAFLVVADSALGAGHLADVGHVLSTFADDRCCFGTRDDSTDVDPGGLVMRVGRGSGSLSRKGQGADDRFCLGGFGRRGLGGQFRLHAVGLLGLLGEGRGSRVQLGSFFLHILDDLVQGRPLCVRLVVARG